MNRRNKLITFLGISALITMAFFVTKIDQSKGEMSELEGGIVVQWGPTSSFLHPHQVNDLNSHRIITHIYEGLFRRGPDDVLLPGISEYMQVSEDNTEYKFHLRESYWSDGTPLTADDFVRSWQSVINNKDFLSHISVYFDQLKGSDIYRKYSLEEFSLGIKAETPSVLVVKLQFPITHFLKLLTLPEFMPIHIYHDPVCPITNGPFKVNKIGGVHSFILEKNSYFWDKDSVNLSQIKLIPMGNEDKQITLFEKGQTHFIGYGISPISNKGIERLKKTGQLSSFFDTTGQVQLWINTKKDPFSSESVRHSFSLALDRNVLASQSSILYSPARGYLPSQMKKENFISLLRESPFESKQFLREGLEELDLPFSIMEEIKFIVPMHLSELGVLLQRQWADNLGVMVEIEILNSVDQLSRMRSGNFDIALDSFFTFFDDPYASFPFYFQDYVANYTGWNPNYFQLLFEEGLSLVGKERNDHIDNMEEYITSSMPVIPIFSRREVYGIHPRLKGVFIGKCFDVDFSRGYWELTENFPKNN